MPLTSLLVPILQLKNFKGFSFFSAVLLGACFSLAFAPLNFFPILFVCIGGLLILINQAPLRRAFLLGWLFGLGHFIGSLYWLYYAFETVNLGYLGPLAILGLSLWLALFPGLASALTCLFSKSSFRQAWLFATFWSLTEWLRGQLLTGFPWNLVGYTWGCNWGEPVLQSTAWIGIYGLSFLTILTAASFSSRSWKMILACLTLMLSLRGYGAYRLDQGPFLKWEDLNLRLVQASIPQQQKWLPEAREKNLRLYLTLSQIKSRISLIAILWPEAAVTLPLYPQNEVISLLQTCIPKGGILITGGIRVDSFSRESLSIYNSLFVISDQGHIVNCYDKAHLTPFGEYMPLRKILRLNKLTHGNLDYQAGPESKILKIGVVPPFQPLICYEGIFPHFIKDLQLGAKWFLSLTNDTWFGSSWGPYQHLAIVRVRAIEHGVPLIRTANHGISAVIDAYGRILHRLELNQVGVIDFALPKPLSDPTFYSRWREFPFSFLLIIGLIMGRPFCDFRRKINT